MMVHKKVEWLPVVQDGVLIGIVTRGKVRGTLYLGATKQQQTEEDTDL